MGTLLQGHSVDRGCYLVVRERAEEEGIESQVRRQDARGCHLVVREWTEDAGKELQGREVGCAFDCVG